MKEWYPEADLIIENAKIYTVALTIEEIKQGKYDFPVLENGAVAVKDGRIIAVCGTEDAAPHRGPRTKVVDAGGKTLVPGFVDSHIHAMWTGLDMAKIDFGACTNREAFLRLVEERAASTPAGKWIEGLRWNHLSWDDTALPTRWELDRICPDKPVFLMRVCYHVAVANSKALELAGITRGTPQPEGGEIVLDEQGEPTGVLYENGAMGMIQSIIPPPGMEDFVKVIGSMGEELNKVGITSIIDANLSYEQMRAYGIARSAGALRYRASLLYFLDSAKGDIPHHLNRLEESVVNGNFGDDMLRLNAVKILLDGIPANGTAYMRRNYKHMPETNGAMNITEQELDAVVGKANDMDWQVSLHTVGNKAADMALAAFSKANKMKPVYDRRHYLIHHPWPCEDQFPLMRDMNIGVPLQPTIYHLHGESAILHEDMAHYNTPCKTYFDEGIIVGGSSDNPVGSYNPFLNFYICVTRKDVNGQVWGAEQKITPQQALIMWTKNSAFFSFDDDKLGSIEVGNLADLVLTDRDFLTCPPDDILDTRVEMTVLNGAIVYQR